ncbi:MAG: carbamoyltransferase HypF [Pseudomonadota bacterium]
MHDTTARSSPHSRLLRLGGQVQGVGFRPFVYRTATASGLTGWVENRGAEVQLLLQGEPAKLDAVQHTLLNNPPPLARPRLLAQHTVERPPSSDFRILPSRDGEGERAYLPPDQFVCDDCLRELHTPHDRRHRYPFINCTQCGPRYTVIDTLPYDRASTALAGFPLCAACRAEYEDPRDRRFHAEPTACPECGPRLSFHNDGIKHEDNETSLAAAIELLRDGGIVAVKGIGGYHLMCDASNAAAIDRLRQRKARPHKPLAVMFPLEGEDGLDALRRHLVPTGDETALLRSPLRPIVLCRRGDTETLPHNLAPELNELGAMLPYSPLHHLLLHDFGTALVATSGNLSGEPVLTDESEAQQRLANIADGYLHHNRPIRRPADDPLYRSIAGNPRPLRLGRGNAPLELTLPLPLPRPLLAVGGEMKNAIALAWGERAVLSPHIGELHSPRATQVFEQTCRSLQQLYGTEAETVVCDAHPDYYASRWARQSGLALQAVYHHHAHASALFAEYWPEDEGEQWLVATWDGAGFGPDTTLWGGETLLGRPGHWQRFSRLRPFRLPGGERAAREPWRSALALCLESDTPWPDAPPEAALLSQAWQRGLNCPTTSSAGRLFDAAAALLGVCQQSSFEGQAPMWLEAAAQGPGEAITLPLEQAPQGLWQSDWQPLLPLLLETKQSVARRAFRFHLSLARSLLTLAQKSRSEQGIETVGLTGGVFQNRLLCEMAVSLLEAEGFTVRLPQKLPGNDAGLAWGQLVEAACRAE